MILSSYAAFTGILGAAMAAIAGGSPAMVLGLAVFAAAAITTSIHCAHKVKLLLRASSDAVESLEIFASSRSEDFTHQTETFENNMKRITGMVGQIAGELQTSAVSMLQNAATAQDKSTATATAASDIQTNTHTVAIASQQLSTSIDEINQQIMEAGNARRKTIDHANTTSQEIQQLQTATMRIGEVIPLINDIAKETNILALNATIEAVRAGEAGQGFAAVARQIKNLSAQTAKANEIVAQQIEVLRNVTERTTSALNKVVNVIGESNGVSSGIIAAITQQRAATQEISRNVQEVVTTASTVWHNLGIVSGATTENRDIAGNVLNIAGGLTREAKTLETEVEKFLTTVRST
jgi:methyl-accepting chemotaxis protein